VTLERGKGADRLLPLAIAVGLFLLRVWRHPWAVAVEGSDLIVPIQLFAHPEWLVGHPLREAMTTTLSPLQWIWARGWALFDWPEGIAETLRLALLCGLAVGGVWTVAQALFKNRRVSLLAVILLIGGGAGALGMGFAWKIGVYHAWHFVAFSCGLWILAALLRGRWEWAAAGLGLFFSIHPTHAVILCGLAAPLLLWAPNRPTGARRLRCAAWFLLALLPAVIYFLPRWQIYASAGLDPETWWALMRIRKNHHLFPFSWGGYLWGGLLAYAAAGGWVRHRMERSEEQRLRDRGAGLLAAGAGVLCAAGVFFSEIRPVVLLAKLTLLRASDYLLLLLSLYLCASVESALSDPAPVRRWSGIALAIGLLFLDYAIRWTLPLVFLSAAFLAGRSWRLPEGTGGRFAAVVRTGLLGLAACNIFVQALPPLFAANPRLQLRLASENADWKETQDWARENSRPDAVFLNPPDWSGFEVFSRRTPAISWQDLGRSIYSSQTARSEIDHYLRYHLGPEPLPWRREAFWGLAEQYRSLSDAELLRLGERFGADYAILPAAAAPHPTLKPVHQNRHFTVYRLHGGTG